MSLYKTSDGILETHVTWHDVEESLQKTLSTKATFGENKKATNISDMKGFMSRIALVEPDWVGVEDGKQLPDKFIVKISSQMALLALSKIMQYESENGFSDEKLDSLSKVTRETHNREVGAYELLTKFNHPNIPFTKIYALKAFEDDKDLKGFIAAEYIPDLNTNIFQSVSADDLFPVVRAIATFAALGESVSAEEKQFADGSKYIETLFTLFFDDNSLKRNFESIRVTLGDENKEKVDKVIDIFCHYRDISGRYSNISERIGLKLALNHGDLWISNILHRLDDHGKMNVLALIDWQAVSLMPPGTDLSRLLIATLLPDDRKNRGVELLRYYYEVFTATHGKELFSFQELLNGYHLYLPIMSMAVLPGIVSFLNQAQLPEEQKAAMRKMALHLMIGIVDDVLEAHEHNLKNYPDFIKSEV